MHNHDDDIKPEQRRRGGAAAASLVVYNQLGIESICACNLLVYSLMYANWLLQPCTPRISFAAAAAAPPPHSQYRWRKVCLGVQFLRLNCWFATVCLSLSTNRAKGGLWVEEDDPKACHLLCLNLKCNRWGCYCCFSFHPQLRIFTLTFSHQIISTSSLLGQPMLLHVDW